MIFQIVDEKNECNNIFFNENLIDYLPDNISKTWSYFAPLKGKKIEYANLYVNGSSLEEICPEHLKNNFNIITKKLHYIHNSFVNAKISLKENCFYDLVPNRFLQEFCDVKNKISEYVFENYDRPKQYDFLCRFNELLFDIKNREQNIDFDLFKNDLKDEKSILYYRKLLNLSKNIDYNLFGSITGRLTTTKDSFPIQNFPRKYRKYLKPKNDWFISFDMNAAELRTSIALLDKQQPEGDFYEYLKNKIFDNKLSRTEVKEITTSWLYNANNPNISSYKDSLEQIFEKETLKNKYWDGKYVYTPYDRKIESDQHHIISYLNQSTFIDLFHRQVLLVDDFLNKKETFISFLLHDQFVLDLKDSEKSDIIQIIKILQKTKYGNFPVKVEVGKNFGEMKKLNLKVEND